MEADKVGVLTRPDIFRLIVALIADEMGRVRGRDLHPAEVAAWDGSTTIDEEGVGADSLLRLDLALRLNVFFHLHEAGLEDWLLVRRTLADWVEIVARCRAQSDERITVQTSGSTGAPKACTHRLADLRAEAADVASLFVGRRRIVTLVPPHHVFGLLFTTLMPAVTGLPLLDLRAIDPGRWAGRLDQGDLLVATPHLLDLLRRAGQRVPGDVAVLTSTAPLSPALAATLTDLGVARIVELYGSTETAGIGHRDDPSQPFALFQRWERASDDTLADRTGRIAALPDLVVWTGPRSLRPAGRLDGAIKIAGHIVDPKAVGDRLRDHAGVADCVVRARGAQDAPDRRLEAFIVRSEAALDDAALEAELRRHCAHTLRPAERPTSYRFGDCLPLDALGKPTRW